MSLFQGELRRARTLIMVSFVSDFAYSQYQTILVCDFQRGPGWRGCFVIVLPGRASLLLLPSWSSYQAGASLTWYTVCTLAGSYQYRISVTNTTFITDSGVTNLWGDTSDVWCGPRDLEFRTFNRCEWQSKLCLMNKSIFYCLRVWPCCAKVMTHIKISLHDIRVPCNWPQWSVEGNITNK